MDGGDKISIGLGSVHYSHDYLVLTAHPTAADIAKLDSISGNIVDISGNEAHNHGGGVATNGSCCSVLRRALTMWLPTPSWMLLRS